MAKTTKVDASVRPEETELRKEPIGSVPLDRTMRKPEAYSSGGKLNISNGHSNKVN